MGNVERFHIISLHSRQQNTHSSHSQQLYPHRAGAAFSLPSMPPAPPFLQPPGGPSPGGMPTLGGMGGLNAQQVGAVPSTSCLLLLQQQQQYCSLYRSYVAAAPYAAKKSDLPRCAALHVVPDARLLWWMSGGSCGRGGALLQPAGLQPGESAAAGCHGAARIHQLRCAASWTSSETRLCKLLVVSWTT